MTDLANLVIEAKTYASELEKLFSNFKKDSITRKTTEYVATKRVRIQELWEQFVKCHADILKHQGGSEDHPYFTSNYYNQVLGLYNSFIEALNKVDSNLQQKASVPQFVNPTEASDSNDVNVQKMHRKVRGVMSTLMRTINMIQESHGQIQQRSFYKIKYDTLKALWGQFETMQYDLLGEQDGSMQEDFIRLEEETQQELIWLSSKLDETTITASTASVANGPSLPSITLPKFDGNYLMWRQFSDLFMQTVHNQRMTNCQKMWHLKTNLEGEAERLIRHLTISEVNYDTAWDTLKERYENPRILVSSLLNRLLSQTSHNSETSSASAIKQMHDVTQECLHGLKNIGVNTQNWDPIVLHILVKKLDKTTHALYEQSLQNPRELQSLTDFLKFLENRFQALETLNEKGSTKSKSITVLTTTETCCQKCKSSQHQLFHCGEFRKMSLTAREIFVKKAKLCLNCLRPGHKASECKSRLCSKCAKKHNTLLHFESKFKHGGHEKDANKDISTIQNVSGVSSSSTATTAASTNAVNKPLDCNRKKYVILGTAMITIQANGRSVQCRALLDSGSQINLITAKVVKNLGLLSAESHMTIIGVGKQKQQSSKRVNVKLGSLMNGYSANMEAQVLNKIVPDQPSQKIDVSNWNIPANIQLADKGFNTPQTIDVLIGAEFYHELMTIGQIRLGSELPILQNTLLGWIVIGGVIQETTTSKLCGVNLHGQLDNALERFWKLEEITEPVKKYLSPAEKQCESKFTQTLLRQSDGRYIVRFPFCGDPNSLGDSRELALRRFLAMERKLEKNEILKAQYSKFMEEYLNLNHMEELKHIPDKNYFLPHHAVFKPSSTTTKLRVVFDASAKTTNNISLNDIQHSGPALQRPLFAILLRFRFPRYVFTADIEKMYRQILIHEEDQKYQLILWRFKRTEPIKTYRLRTVTYGTSSAPYLAIRSLLQVGIDEGERYPVGAACIRNDFYVDDVMSGCDKLVEAIDKKQQLRALLRTAGFNLRKWCSNHPRLLEDIHPEDQETQLDFSDDLDYEINTLGLTWMPKSDEFVIKVNLRERNKITKRSIASDVASLFDPLGMLSPVVVKAKVFLQHLWELKIDWDAALPLSIVNEWNAFRNELPQLNGVKIGRHLFGNQVQRNMQLHGFADASERAYGAVIYVRSIHSDGRIVVRLLCSKSKVSPKKKITLPRLELCAAKLLAELMDRVKSYIQIWDVVTYLWTDSEIVLAWINSPSSDFQTFVANRIASIHEVSIPSQWRHVRSKENPADVVSRGLSPTKLKESNLWFYGPRFLSGVESIWPSPYQSQAEITLERKSSNAVTTATSEVISEYQQISAEILGGINHRNSFTFLCHVVAYIRRFINKLQNKTMELSKLVTVEETHLAVSLIVKHMQHIVFKREINDLARGREINASSPLTRLNPFLDEMGVLRITGRIQASGLSYEAKHPKIIPYQHEYTYMILRELHMLNNHVGEHALVALARDNGFWIIRSKNVARAVVKKCVRCVRSKPQLYGQIMGNLPKDRVQPARPFVNAGVDFCGPFWVHYKVRGKRPQKSYIAVFCCFPTKAVHLELVSDLTTDAFIGALKRFMARRGHCRNLYCDNATNFVGAKNQLSELQTSIYGNAAGDRISRMCLDKGIDFHFIPPRAPHFGGLWEAAVKSAKRLLIKSINSASLTYEELETVIVEIEAVLNSRPLTPISPDPNDLSVLTPAHFLIGEPLTSNIDPEAKATNYNLLTRWKLVTHIKQEFWKRWSSEYLHELQQRHKWNKPIANIEPGTLVIVKEDNTNSMNWPLGRIVKAIRGDDGFVRVADVKMSNGIFRRAIHRLAPIPVEETPQVILSSECDETVNDEQVTSESKKDPKEDSLTKEEYPQRKRSRLGTLLLGTLCVMSWITAGNCGFMIKNLDSGLYIESMGSVHLKRGVFRTQVCFDYAQFDADRLKIIDISNQVNNLCNLSLGLHPNNHCVNLVLQLKQQQQIS